MLPNVYHRHYSAQNRFGRFFLLLLAAQFALIFAWGYWDHTSKHPEAPLFKVEREPALEPPAPPPDVVVEKPKKEWNPDEPDEYDELFVRVTRLRTMIAESKYSREKAEKMVQRMLEARAAGLDSAPTIMPAVRSTRP